jgi:hypothetical protein
MTLMMHKRCGGIIAHSVDPEFQAVEGMQLQSRDFVLEHNGKHPRRGSPILCPKCKRQVSVVELEFTHDE